MISEQECADFLTTTTIEYWAGLLKDDQIIEMERMMNKYPHLGLNWRSYLHQDLQEESEEVIRRVCHMIVS